MSARRRRSARLRKSNNNHNKNIHPHHSNNDNDEDLDLPSSTTNNSPQSTSITTNNLPPTHPAYHHESLSSSQHEQDEPSLTQHNLGHETPENSEEKELSTPSSNSQSQQLSYCHGLSRTPLSVPMVADMSQQSVTRNDAKAITETRLKRLKELSQRPEQALSKDQKDEKKRIIRLEKNRRAAAMSRRKKKMYVKNLEEKTHLMARHLAILEMENSHLRALLQAAQQTNMQQQVPPPPPLPSAVNLNPSLMGLGALKLPNLPQFQVPNLSQFNVNGMGLGKVNNSEVINHSLSTTATATTTTATTTTTSNTSKKQSVDVVSSSNEPTLKKRRLNDGSSVNTISNDNISSTLSPSCDASSDISVLEPLPLPISNHKANINHNHNRHHHENENEMVLPPPPPPPAPSVGFMHHLLPPNLSNIHPSRIVPPPQVRHHPHGNEKRLRSTDVLPKIDKEDGNRMKDKKIKRNQEEGKSMEEMESDGNHNNNDQNIPPPVVVPRLSNEFMTLLDDDMMDECNGGLRFERDIKTDNVSSYL